MEDSTYQDTAVVNDSWEYIKKTHLKTSKAYPKMKEKKRKDKEGMDNDSHMANHWKREKRKKRKESMNNDSYMANHWNTENPKEAADGSKVWQAERKV